MPIFSHQFSGLFLKIIKPEQKPEPLVIEDALGTFTMEHPGKDRYFSGTVALPCGQVDVMLEPDGSGQTTAGAALNSLHAFVPKAAQWDAAIKEFAADDFADQDGMIETWGGCESDSEGEIIAKEEFMRRIQMNFISFYSDGSLFFDYSLDDMFTDHSLGVNADISGKIESCALWG